MLEFGPFAQVVIADGIEVGKTGSQDVVDLLIPGVDVTAVGKIALMQNQICAFIFNELEDGYGI